MHAYLQFCIHFGHNFSHYHRIFSHYHTLFPQFCWGYTVSRSTRSNSWLLWRRTIGYCQQHVFGPRVTAASAPRRVESQRRLSLNTKFCSKNKYWFHVPKLSLDWSAFKQSVVDRNIQHFKNIEKEKIKKSTWVLNFLC